MLIIKKTAVVSLPIEKVKNQISRCRLSLGASEFIPDPNWNEKGECRFKVRHTDWLLRNSFAPDISVCLEPAGEETGIQAFFTLKKMVHLSGIAFLVLCLFMQVSLILWSSIKHLSVTPVIGLPVFLMVFYCILASACLSLESRALWRELLDAVQADL